MTTKWQATSGDDAGAGYAARFRELAASGIDMHGEADLCCWLVPVGSRVLDAGCGTGRVAVELAGRGYLATGVDLDDSMLAQARSAAPDLAWIPADLAELELADAGFDLALLAGNVMVMLTPGTEARVVARIAATLRPGGLLVSGFRLDWELTPQRYEDCCAAAGLSLRHRWSTWSREEFTGTGFAVYVHGAAR